MYDKALASRALVLYAMRVMKIFFEAVHNTSLMVITYSSCEPREVKATAKHLMAANGNRFCNPFVGNARLAAVE